MAWNGSNSAAKPQKVANKATTTVWRGLVAALIIVAGGGLAIWLIMGMNRGEKVQTAKDGKSSLIAEVAPEIAPAKASLPKPQPPKQIDPNARPTKSCEIVNDYVKLPSGRIHKITGVITNSVANRPKAAYEIFERNCNNEIAAYLTLKPGDVIVGTPNYNGRFKKDFLESINEPIIITEDDTPEQAQLKRDVIEARLQLKDAMDNGEDIEQIMLDTRTELQALMVAKMELRHLFYEERQKCETDEDVEDLFKACNNLLEEKGIAPITYGPITKRNLIRSQREAE